jgi:hypothetical protein
MRYLLRSLAATALIVLCALLPFLPGRYDSLAGPLSGMARVLGMGTLLLVPIGTLWVASWRWRRLAGGHLAFLGSTLAVSWLVWSIVSLYGAGSGGISLGILAFVSGNAVLLRVARRAAPLARTGALPACAVVSYLIVTPLAAALLQFVLVRPAIDYSRNRAIRNSEQLIADIERYRIAHGRYPASLLALWPDYSPSVIGIERYQYEPSGDAYNLAFEQPAYSLDTREIVMYNPRGEHVMTSHTIDLLRWTAADLDRRRGHYAVHDLPHASWKYFWFD